ncbi:class I adenylate-forming enzyme family protein [Kitasatospora sp. NPDC048239]|uniref:class I adenylate-forming enzyme family protein n=1 Tax=Kitasatospora sp. NPDC048239 TaxID=3364046 RepID=UPI003715E56D
MPIPSDSVPSDSTTFGAPLDTVAELIGGPRIDDLLRRSARRAPRHPALVAEGLVLDYAGLDGRVSRCAEALRGAFGGPRTVIAIAAELTAEFAVTFLGISRSGNTSAMFNPLISDDTLVHVLNACGARAAVLSPAMHRRVAAVRHRIPALEHIVVTADAGDGTPVLDALPRAAVPDGEEVETACLQFTSGTTGAPKTVRLSHRNLLVNAAQSAYAHRLEADAVSLNNLPSFHLMHLNTALAVGATHVLCPEQDQEAMVELAGLWRATHLYSLPVRLSRLAGDLRLPALRIPSLRAVLSGGSALPPRTTAALSEHFGVPVVQGYGLAETSPSTHFDLLDRPTTGSCGPPVAGTACRIVDVQTGAVLPVGEKGEIQVKGPQLMLGYLGDGHPAVPADGWFSTGDVGRIDEEGRLAVVDRIKDVFKCDNWLVSPTEIERVLMRHPAVADCVVFDHPDELSGAVAVGLVVPRGPDVDPAALAEFANAQLPYYEHLRHLRLVEGIPRSATGKVQRRDLRDWVPGRP